MSTLWIVVEDDEGDDVGDDRLTWWSVDHYEDKDEAIEAAEQLADTIEHQTGSRPVRLDD